ncbi:NB-ARC domain-containing protein, partial [Virgisporangium aurantiacum]|uniref:NB-ARC domain-containing protein n=1 Tax=Virgisporangium aurantiacum TaxID=175570 RepID=UPI001EF3C886
MTEPITGPVHRAVAEGQSVYQSSGQAVQYNAPGGAITVNQYEPVAATVRRPWLAPPLAAGIVARPEVTGRLMELVCSEPGDLVTITGVHGTGGFGKTTLAAWVCHQPEVKVRFPGGLLYVTLGERVAGGQLAAKVNDLVEQLSGVRPALTDPLQAGMRLGEVLDGHPDPVLLVIDDAWTDQQVEPFVCGGSRCQRLLTTRQRRLVDPRRAVQLDQMTSQQAAALLMRDVARGDRRLIDRVLTATGRWPVLVALANRALLRTVDYGATVAQALQGIADRLDEDGPSTFDLDNAHHRGRAVATTVRAGLELLPPGTVDRFFEMAIFAEDADVPLATLHLLWQATAGLTPRRVRSVCEALADLALVTEYRHDTATVRLHDVIRSYLIHEAGPRHAAHLHRTLLDAAARTLPTQAVPPAWWELPQAPDYLTRHLAEHLAAADRHDELAATVTDPRWITARLTRYGPAEAEADLARAATQTARVLGRKIRQNAHLLTPIAPSHALAAVLASRLDHVDAFPTALLRDQPAGPAGRRVVNRWPLPDLPHPALTRTFTGHADRVTAVAVAPDGSWIATGGDTTVRIWDPDTGDCLHTLTGHASNITALKAAADGRWLASSSADHTVRVWDPTTGACRHILTGHAGPVTAVTAPTTGEWIASASHDWTVRVWDPVSGACRMVLAGHAGRLTALVTDSTGGWIASGGQDHTIRVWDTTTGECRIVHNGHTNWIATLAVAPDTRWIASAGGDSTVRIWDPLTGASIHTLAGHIGIVCACVTDPTGSWLATASHDSTVRIWDTDTGACRHVLTGHTGWVVAATAIPGPTPRLATAGHDRTVRIWNLIDGRCEATYTGHTDRIAGLAAAPHGRWLVTTADDRSARTWDPSTPAPTVDAAHHKSRITALACHPAGDWLASASDDHTVRIWDTATGASRLILRGHTNPVRALAVAPDG